MIIKWVNHASLILEHNDVKLISDPWFEGRVFNESWELLSKTKFDYQDYSDITHIWFSHEHPDHFFPPNLKKIPEDIRKNITVLFQETMDRKVIGFCKMLKFKQIIELKELQEYKLGEDFSIKNGKVKNDTDSWLYVKTKDASILNLNDCVFDDKDLEALKNEFAPVDILLTQFSFANWPGNKDNPEAIKAQAKRKKGEIKKHIEYFQAKYTIPFASFVWFCNKDNFHFNEYANRIDDIYEYIKELGSIPIVLYPGDKWVPKTEHDSKSAIENYLKDLSEIKNRQLTEFDTVEEVELKKSAAKFVERALSKNNKAKLKSYKPMKVYLTDLEKAYTLSYKDGLAPSLINEEEADISFHSQNFNYILSHEWGFDTILVAGTFQKPKKGNFRNFMEYQWIATLNNQGKRMKGIVGRILDRVFK